jgi:hypothetical protein
VRLLQSHGYLILRIRTEDLKEQVDPVLNSVLLKVAAALPNLKSRLDNLHLGSSGKDAQTDMVGRCKGGITDLGRSTWSATRLPAPLGEELEPQMNCPSGFAPNLINIPGRGLA